ncbi:hemin ABC transporter ATP-binding protein [Nocardioides sp. Root1257]|uniref:heme ABC transporter ATP-binding protein n=1 Tax=unclassified Nocardioides TaxID=2615069 RepID=UPI0006FB3EA3|nr:MULTISPECIES: heme ABC transporter ATP-binding protein [unclassified Nocardioides]KQW45204.1 hemin ABC transporter ATP-binding protein [Nocardioides sp. Root1257]KRC52521.1 hemin ABC transporter ATP-binding protein [Nocardioides sp. Root224]
MTTLGTRGLGVSFDGHPILADVDLDVRGGELVALVGPNGAGKTTLLGVLSGDVDPTSGRVTLDDKPLASYAARELARQRAMQLQKQGLAFGFRVHEVVRMGRSPWHRTAREDDDDRVVAESMERADVTDLADRLYPTLSGGEQARTSFARLLAQETPVLLLDEPTAALDIRHQESLLAVARSAAEAGAAVVVVLHDLSLAAAYADRICVLSRGRVRANGTPADVLTSALLTEVYEHPVEVIAHDGNLLVVPVRVKGVVPWPAG